MNDSLLRFTDALVDHERQEALVKHGYNQTPMSHEMSPEKKLVILVEEVGEVARAITYDEGSKENLKKELAQVAAMATMWLASLL